MRGRGLLLLALLTVLAVGGALLTRQSPVAPPDEGGEAYFLPGLKDRLDEVERVRVHAPDGSRLAEIVRREGGWTVANRRDYPADPETLRGSLIGLAEARRLAPKSDRAEGHARLGVADPGASDGSGILLRLEGLDPPIGVLIGSAAPGDAGGTHVRRADEQRAWLVSGALQRHDEIADWLDDRLVDVEAVRVHRVRIAPVDGQPVRVLLPSPDAPRFEIENRPHGRRPLSSTLSKSIARGIADLRLTDVVPAAETEPPPRLAVARFETFDGLVIEIEAFADSRENPSERLVRLRVDALDNADDSVRKQARSLNARFDGWFYRIPDYKFINLTFTLEQILEPLDGTANERE